MRVGVRTSTTETHRHDIDVMRCMSSELSGKITGQLAKRVFKGQNPVRRYHWHTPVCFILTAIIASGKQESKTAHSSLSDYSPPVLWCAYGGLLSYTTARL